jgi:hypothetical protein
MIRRTDGVSSMSDDWKGVVNQILFGVLDTPRLDDDAADRMARAMVERRYFGDGPAAYAAAVEQALEYSGPLADEVGTPHGEEAFRAFLRQLAARLEAHRPWPSTSG